MQWLGGTSLLALSTSICSNAHDVTIRIQVACRPSPRLVARLLNHREARSNNPNVHSVEVRYVKAELRSGRDRTMRWVTRIEREVNERSIGPRVRSVLATVPGILKVALMRLFL